MLTLSATDLAIAGALKTNSLIVTERQGRFGTFWSIEDAHGLIEVALTAEEAAERIGTALKTGLRLRPRPRLTPNPIGD